MQKVNFEKKPGTIQECYNTILSNFHSIHKIIFMAKIHRTFVLNVHKVDIVCQSALLAGFVRVLENPESPGFYYAIFQDWKVLEKGHWSWKVLEIC